MNSLNYLFQKNKFLLILIGVGLLMLLITVVVSLTIPESPMPPASPRPSSPTSQRPPSYFPAQIQEYTNQSSTEKGVLAVNANTENVKVTIDQNEVQNSEFFAPDNVTPFIVNPIPTGIHILRASKLGFLNQTLSIEVKPNQVTEIYIQMQTDPDFNSLENVIKEMPVSTDDYYIEYLVSIGKIQVLIKREPFETYKQSAIDWFKQKGVENPEQSGVLFYPAVNTE